jgi:UDP-N-acetylmuramate: L-alanyl-gamma-D-glutamyl-meso-diaminopimelate ligase
MNQFKNDRIWSKRSAKIKYFSNLNYVYQILQNFIMLRVHLIAIGGSIMHNLAIALHQKGYKVTGSDDIIFEPAKSRLLKEGILPESEAWDAHRIDPNIDLIILGMHAKNNNIELLRALELGIPVKSFPEFISQEYKNKKQLVVTGSHGKTSTSAMLLHVLNQCGVESDYLVGAQLEGFQNMVSITDAPYAVIEGDEYLSSCLDSRPKFLHYHSFIHIITGIAWDHYNVFPKYSLYKKAFEECIVSRKKNTHIVYYQKDPELNDLINQYGTHLIRHPYAEARYLMKENNAVLLVNDKEFPLQIFGKHNMQNIAAVMNTSIILGLNPEHVAEALTSFKGAAKRMELIYESDSKYIYRDFAHAPSKVVATLDAFRERFPNHRILVVLELHTYSSLNKDFLPQYANSVNSADQVIVYIDRKAMELKNMNALNADFIKAAFNNEHILICQHKEELNQEISQAVKTHEVIIFMGSGHFGGIDIHSFIS